MAKKADSPLRSRYRVAIRPEGEEKRYLLGPRLYTFGVFATLNPLVHSVVGISLAWIGGGIIYAVVHLVAWLLELLEAAFPLGSGGSYIAAFKTAINYMGLAGALATLVGYTLVAIIQVFGIVRQEFQEVRLRLLRGGHKDE